MARLIDADALDCHWRVPDGVDDEDSYDDGVLMMLNRIEKAPTVDAVPVVRGKWRFEKGDGKTCVDGWVCTNCNCGFHTNVPYFEEFNFCPNCGADMREES